MFWLAVLVFAVAAAWIVLRIRGTMQKRKFEEEARAANFLAVIAGAAGAAPAAAAPADAAPRPMPAAAIDELAQQKLLFDAAHKAGEAGEPTLSIQLYARLLARYPSTTLAEPARAAVEAQKKKLPKER